MIAESTDPIVCIGCGCDDLHACQVPQADGFGACHWVAVDEAAGIGICSVCAIKPIREWLGPARELGVELAANGDHGMDEAIERAEFAERVRAAERRTIL